MKFKKVRRTKKSVEDEMINCISVGGKVDEEWYSTGLGKERYDAAMAKGLKLLKEKEDGSSNRLRNRRT
jgi:hypothetical protein